MPQARMPVSYTHLDVYKRQVLLGLIGIAATGVTFRNVLNSAQSFASRREASH